MNWLSYKEVVLNFNSDLKLIFRGKIGGLFSGNKIISLPKNRVLFYPNFDTRISSFVLDFDARELMEFDRSKRRRKPLSLSRWGGKGEVGCFGIEVLGDSIDLVKLG